MTVLELNGQANLIDEKSLMVKDDHEVSLLKSDYDDEDREK